ncbi:MerR family transcriptional regulator [Sphingomonas sp.]|uniref:MerR family transcriptional regulator n=1 Tax=Sphingomonas sp. TaxID=28214 RepID=UPI000DB3C856|nr:MerR family transcriptional regulator [Sphingomonas sp.]PZU11851.1 MAG: MerR family transcriptional regulator [Sphingomonas sp.]
MSESGKSDGAFRTIGEVAEMLGLPQHILRYWETRFPQVKPLQRAGNRRYYRPADVALVQRINQLLNQDGYTIKGVQKQLAEEARKGGVTVPPVSPLRAIRDALALALVEDARRSA